MDTDIQKKLDALKQSYAKDLDNKIQKIVQLWQQFKKQQNQIIFADLFSLAHGLHGSAGAYGYKVVSQVSGALEENLNAIQDKEELLDAEIDAIDLIVENLSKMSENSFPRLIEEPAVSVSDVDTKQKKMYVLNSELTQDKKFQNDLENFGYQSIYFNHQKAFIHEIQSAVPDVLLVGCDMLTLHLTKVLQNLIQDYPNILIIITALHDSLPNRLKAVRAGGQVFLIQPFTFEELLSSLDNFCKFKKLDYNILIVDDSMEVAEYYALILQKEGMNIYIENDPMSIDKALMEFNPDLILMDMYMPACNGLELAAIIRQQENYASIPIVFLSSEEDREKQLKAMRLGVDDFISKSTRDDFLILSIINRVERYRKLRSLIIKDSLTSTLNHNEIQKRLINHLKEASRLKTPVSVVMIDLDNFKKVNDNYGHQVGDRILKNLCHILKKRLRSTDDIGRQGGEEFLIILPNTPIKQAKDLIELLREQFEQITYVSNNQEFHVTFSAGIACYPKFSGLNEIIKAADSALYEAKQAGRNRVCVEK